MAKTRKQEYEEYKERCLAKNVCLECGKSNDRQGMLKCSACVEKHRLMVRQNTAYCRQHNMCPRCGREFLWGSEKMCLECGAKSYANGLAYKSANRDKVNANKRERYAIKHDARLEQGLCTICGKKRNDYHKICALCRLKINSKRREKVENIV